MSFYRLCLLLTLLTLAACAPYQTLRLAGLSAAVSITRDQWGIPHIRAASDSEVFFALGYAHAQDRLWQMETYRRAAQGRLAEWVGSSALEQDKLARTWGFYRTGAAQWSVLSEFTQQALKAYSAGVNGYIREGRLPIEYSLLGVSPEAWTPEDSLGIGKALAYDLGQIWQDEVDQAFLLSRVGLEGLNDLRGQYPEGWPTIIQAEDYRRVPGFGLRVSGDISPSPLSLSNLHPSTLESLRQLAADSASLPHLAPDDSAGSNNWVVSGSRSATGKPLLAGDPHLRFQNPALWYAAELRGPTYNSRGATIAGLPAVLLGRNDQVAWSATNARPDVMDLFVLDLEGNSYRTPRGLVPLKTRSEIIKVRYSPEVQILVRESEHGPIISDLSQFNGSGASTGGAVGGANQALAVRWTALEPGDTTMDAYFGINRAKNAAEFKQAMRLYVAPMQNFVYADQETIGEISPGRIPLRDWDTRLPASAAKGQNWKGFLSFEQWPQVENPKEGFIASANNRILPHGAGPDISSYSTEIFRSTRIRELLQSNNRVTLEDMARWQGDTYSVLARELRPGLLALSPKSESARRLQDTLRNWDLLAGLNSAGATAFAFYYRQIMTMLEDETGIRYPNVPSIFMRTLNSEGRWCDDVRTAVKESCAQWMAMALEQGAAELEKLLGPDPAGWRWERLHKAEFNAALGTFPLVGGWLNRSIATPGSVQTLNVANYNQNTFVHTSGVSLRLLFDLNDPDETRIVYPLGQSGDFLNGHYDDLLKLWRDNQSIKLSANPRDWGSGSTVELRP
jgi:penicillin amidase